MPTLSLEEIVVKSAKDPARPREIFNNSAQVWNHDFYWKSMKSGGGGEPAGQAGRAQSTRISATWRNSRKPSARPLSGSSAQAGRGSSPARTASSPSPRPATPTRPVAHGEKALFTTDVWEHGPIISTTRTAAPDHVNDFLGKLITWDFRGKEPRLAREDFGNVA